MVEKLSVLKGAVEIARTLGYLAGAAEKMKQGRDGEAYVDLGRGASNAIKNWDLISHAAKTLWHAFDAPSFSTVESTLAASAGARSGFFTGKWDSQPGRVELIYHDKYTNAISLFFQKTGSNVFQLSDGSGYNLYKGVVDPELGLLVLTGFNSEGLELIIIGEPDNEGHRIECDSWRRTGNSQIARMDRFVLVRHPN